MIDKLKVFYNDFIREELLLTANSLAIRVILAILLAFVCLELVKILKKSLKKTLKKFKVDEGIAGFLVSAASIVLYIIVAFLIAQGLGVDAATIVAVLGSAGVTVGLAIQGSLANIAGGVLILVLKPFKVGDYIIEDTNMNEGKVLEIGLIYTKLQTIDSKTVVLPNGTLANASIVNVTHTPVRMIDMSFDIAYDTDIVLAKELIRDIVTNDEKVLTDRPIDVVMESWESSSVKLNARFLVKNDDIRTTKCRILENVKISFDMNKIEIPYPQIVVHDK